MTPISWHEAIGADVQHKEEILVCAKRRIFAERLRHSHSLSFSLSVSRKALTTFVGFRRVVHPVRCHEVHGCITGVATRPLEEFLHAQQLAGREVGAHALLAFVTFA
eukprot:scaffold133_cov257-Pinguiococcus_pyrenoidosus.AAC.23